jgi:hypothetical protein
MTAGNNGKVIWLQKTTEKWYDCRKQWKGDMTAENNGKSDPMCQEWYIWRWYKN